MRRISILILVLILISLSMVNFNWAGDKKTKDTVSINTVIPLKIESLEWKLKYYQEKTVSMQLRAMIKVWNQVEFQDIQRIIRQTNQEIKHNLILK